MVIRRVRHTVTAALSVLALTLVGVVAIPVVPAQAVVVGDLVAALDAESPMLAGADGSFTVTVDNQGADRFNLGFAVLVPDGLTPGSAATGQGAAVGEPRVVPSGALGAGQPPAGFALWVWEDVSDLPAGAGVSLTVPYAADPVVFPVGSTIAIETAAHASTEPRYRPVFPGSIGVGGSAAEAATASSPPAVDDVPVTALRLDKAQLTYAENEVLRGVHDQGAVYELVVTNTNQGTTGAGGAVVGVEVVDWLPAGLEFLGCGGVDNSTYDWSTGTPGSAAPHEYPGAGALGGTVAAGADCRTPDEVATVVATAADAATFGVQEGAVHTRVTWSLDPLAAGSTTRITYAVGVPLHENTVDWAHAAAGEPTPDSLGQAANLDNNTGPSTRHGDPALPQDGGAWTNAARAAGHFDGPIAPGTDREVWDTDAETITAMDLAIVKDVDRPDFAHGETAGFVLTVSTSEYASSSGVTVTDTIPDGLCLVPTAGSTSASDCIVAPGAAFGDWNVTDVAGGASDGSQTVTFAYGPGTLAANSVVTLRYHVLMGVEYDRAGWGPTTAGDGFTNSVTITGTTTLEPGVQDRFPGEGPWAVLDDSSAGLSAPVATISKRVLARGALPAAGCEAVSPGSGDWRAGDDTDPAGDFRLGDTVCYLLTVDFPDQVDTRNAVVTDVLPEGIAYAGSAASGTSPVVGTPTIDDRSLVWEIGTPGTGTADRIVPAGATLHLYVRGTVTPDAVGAVVDKPENLMKYRQENVAGDVFFLRDQAATEIVPPPLSILKGVRDVDGETGRAATRQAAGDGAAFDSDRDGIAVVHAEEVTFRVDLTADYPVRDVLVWDLLPSGLNPLTQAEVTGLLSGLPASATVQKGSTLGLTGANGQRWVVAWDGVAVDTPAGGPYRTTLTYTVTVSPRMAEVGSTHRNDATVVSYEADTNTGGGTATYYPVDGPEVPGVDPADRVPAPAGRTTTDPSSVLVESVDVTKGVTSAAGTNNAGSPTVPGPTTQVAIGEWATYTYSVTIPARTSVIGGVLGDALPTPTNWEIDAGATRVTYPGGSWAAATAGGVTTFTHAGGVFTVAPASGQLTFPPGTYTVGAVDETFTVELTARVRPSASWTHAPTTNRTDTASFRSSGALKDSATAGTRVIEPNPQVSKVADEDTIVAGQVVTYTLQAWNQSGRPTSFDTVVVDCVPAGLAVRTPVLEPTGTSVVVDPAASGCAGTLITWSIGDLAAEGATPGAGEIASRRTLTYDVVIDPAAGAGVRYDNTATIAGWSVPDDRSDPTAPDPRRRSQRTASERITAITPVIDKTVDGAAGVTAVVGEIVDYQVVVTIPVDINLYDTTIVDVVPAGIAVSGVQVAYGPTWGTPPSAMPAVSGQTIMLDLGDVLSADDLRTVTLTYRGTVTDVPAVAEGVTLENTATLSWNGVDGDAATRSPVVADATVTVREPAVTIAKHVDGSGTTPAAQDAIDVDAGGSFHYRVVVANTGTAPALDVRVVDTVPAGVVVAAVSDGGVVTGADPVAGGGTITWTIESLAVDADRTLTYAGSLASSTRLDGTALENVAEVTEYFSHPGVPGDHDPDERRGYAGPEDDASVTPLFPEPTITKTVAPGVTALGEPVGFRIVVTNDGDGPLTTYELVDMLPAGWSVADVSPAPATQSGTVADGLTLTWTGGPIAPGASVTITYDAAPDPDHPWTTATLGLAYDHTNTARVSGTDGSGASEHLDPAAGDPVPYEDEDAADVTVPLADLALAKSVVTADVVAGEPITWGLDVTNLGPDAEAGPVTITDTLPAGVVADTLADLTVAGPGWSAVSYDAATRLLTLGRAGGVLAPSGGVPGALPRVTVTAVVEAGFVPAGSATRTLTNGATVAGTTDELVTDNNDDDTSVSVRPNADLELDKSAVTTSYVPGRDITWEIDVTNHGPSVSRTPFTVTDTLPAEVDPTTLELLSGADWSVVGGAPVGNVVTFEYDGADLGAGDATSTLRYRATVRSNLLTTDPIVNGAVVIPTTPDDDLTNNDDDAPVDHDTALADLSLVKSLASDDLVAGEGGRYRIEVTNDGPSYAVAVDVTDTLPEGLAYAGGLVSQTGDTWALDDEQVNADGTTTLTFSLDSGSHMLPDGASTWFEFDVAVASWVTADVTNVAEVSSTTPDPDPDDNEDPETSPPLVETNLSVTKAHDDAVRRVGDTVVFTVVVTNHGPADATDVELVDALPAGLTFAGLTDVLTATDGRAWTPAVVDDVLTATLDDPLPAGGTAVVEITATLTAASFPNVTNVVTVSTATDETDPEDNTATDPVPVDSPDLRVVKTAGAGSVRGGDELTYTIVVTNHGGARADEVTLTDTLPAELGYVSSRWDAGDPAQAVGDACVAAGADAAGLGGTLDCLLPGGLAAGQSATLVVTLAVPAGIAVDSVTNEVTVASVDEDPSLRDDNDDDETTPVRWIAVAAAPVCALEAPWLEYEVDLHNVTVGSRLVLEWYADADGDGVPDGTAVHSGPVGVALGDTLDGRVLWPGAAVDEAGTAVALPGHRPAVAGEVPTWQHLVEDASLPEHALLGDVLVRFSIDGEQWVTAAYPGLTPDCLVARDTELEIEKTAGADRVDAGGDLTYSIEVRNTGDGAARDVVVTDAVPAQLKVVAVRTAAPTAPDLMPWGECEVTGADARGYGGTVTCELDGVLARGQTAPAITIVTTVDPEAGTGDVVNVAEVEWVSADDAEQPGTADDDAEVRVVGAGELPVTGAEIVRLLAVAVALMATGLVVVLAVRVRRT